ncbi:MAG: 2-oxoglutarate dehydrogenase complex dihydrolipoyllysine-residue succinyltransferase [Bacteroidetes bacterium]|nr:2-oxoglutarate dehydrogenase complex dihydrolipoyllysine-residue succinyltransferase [Bacteroidota bacterium]MBP6427180.1 2-oxoglutarate dehydrogenase complex dihydrolipoyllysine-residue succinyltransferase [Bacteroidia bacterium]MBK8364005.1 2-oxoglutarate dehydrogenase complex dihydrolipoyllysine-residue succinyltransferase [Bacteroidota bacterium]MBK9415026.1 2-oxoglutarate dehydrogenase complex dihydrolipoyllysine-residue succinyltransferase [Bacteroidota bacterium]MBL0031458.1 2-oxoglut
MSVVEMKVPSPGESITEVQIAKWIKKDGDYVEKDEELCEIDSDKATLTLNAEASGVIKILAKEGETIAVGSVVCSIDTEAKGEKPAAKTEEKVEAKVETKAESKPQSATKTKEEPVTVKKDQPVSEKTYAEGVPSVAAEKILREKGIAADKIEGTGKGGRITKADVLNPNIIDMSTRGGRNVRREKMTMLRKKVAERLVAVKQETAMLTTFNEVDMSAIMKIRKQYKDVFKEKHGVGLGFMSFFTKAVCEALLSFPAVNGQIDGTELVYHDYCDIGIAVSAPKGLMVPVIRNAESKSLAQIETAVNELATKARDGKITLEEMTGGTFTITNGGVFGSMLSTPIINPPQSAILGMHNIVERAVVVDGKIEVRPIMYVALSYDHRIIDGRESVGFLVKVKQMLENPTLMLFGGNDPNRTLLGL